MRLRYEGRLEDEEALITLAVVFEYALFRLVAVRDELFCKYNMLTEIETSVENNSCLLLLI